MIDINNMEDLVNPMEDSSQSSAEDCEESIKGKDATQQIDCDNIAVHRERGENNNLNEGEKYNPLKAFTSDQIAQYANQGIQDYLTFFRLSTNNRQISKYERTLKTIQVQGVVEFVDPEFMPSLSSLIGSNNGGRNSWKGLKWIRPRNISGYQNAQLFQGDIEPNDIRQGYLGDCYFLSSIASLAEWPERIKSLFKEEKPNLQGCHCVIFWFACNIKLKTLFKIQVRICDKGEWKEVILDEYFPCVSSARGPAFTKGNQAETWVMLLEKAWAKINGSYDAIEAGLTRECLHDFTGAPTETLWLDEEQNCEQTWNKLLIGERNNYAMTCGSNDQISKDLLDKMGIISGHAYSLLGAYEVTHNGHLIRLIKLRNPWGQKEWTGNWRDGDKAFNELSTEDITKLGIAERSRNGENDDGIFFMEYKELRKYFTDVQVCYIHDDFSYVSIKGTSSRKQGKFYQMHVSQKGRYFLSVNQQSKRKYPKDMQKEFKYSNVTLLIAKQESTDTYTYIEGHQKEDREVWTGEAQERELEAGTYLVYVKVQWRYNEQEEFVLSSYGIGSPVFKEVTKIQARSFLSETYFSHAKLISKRQKKIIQDGKAWILVDQTDDGFFYIAAENNSEQNMNCHFKLSKMAGLKLKKPFQGSQAQFSLLPGQHQTLILRVKDYQAISGLSISQTITFQ